MNFFHNYFSQETPSSDRGTLPYYLQSLNLSDNMMAVYAGLMFMLLLLSTGQFFLSPLLFLGAIIGKRYLTGRISIRLTLLIQALTFWAWCTWFVVTFGWKYGGQHFLLLIVLLVFFSVYEPPKTKIVYFLLTLAIRLLLYDYSIYHEPLVVFAEQAGFFCQVVNSLTLFVILAGCCIIYSSNLQETTRQLLLHNEQLQHQAETDPLTRLYNRRHMTYEMNHAMEINPRAIFCIAIADIDFFKQINDTYGHNCGDYVLQELAALLLQKSEGRYTVARWGGEEFCFFLPEMNLDDAAALIFDVCDAARKMNLEFEGNRFHITLTAGVEDNDFHSTIAELVERADKKLYMGKEAGRDRVIF